MASLFFNRLQPETQGQIFPIRVSQGWPQLHFITFLECTQVERDRPRQISHVIPVTLNVPLQLGQGDSIWVAGEEPQMFEGPREHLRQSLFVVFWNGSDGNEVQVHAVRSVKLRPLSSETA